MAQLPSVSRLYLLYPLRQVYDASGWRTVRNFSVSNRKKTIVISTYTEQFPDETSIIAVSVEKYLIGFVTIVITVKYRRFLEELWFIISRRKNHIVRMAIVTFCYETQLLGESSIFDS